MVKLLSYEDKSDCFFARPLAGPRCVATGLSGGTRWHTGAERSLRSRRLQQEWNFAAGYRYQPSFRHFVGTVEQVQRERLGNQILNIYHMFDVSVSRQITKRISANATLPILFAYRNQLYAPRGEFRNSGIGDATVGVHSWLFRPPTESNANIGVGVSLKMPTGKYNSIGPALAANGTPILATADQSIQAGDGGTGFAVDLQAFHPAPFRTMMYFNAIYLFNPRNTNGVSTFRNRRGETVLSVTDQYMYRGGFSRGVPRSTRIIRQLRRPHGRRTRARCHRRQRRFPPAGYSISADPGFMYNRWGSVWSVSIPVAIERNRKRSVPDYQNGIHGDAAFADYSVIVGFSRRF